MGISIGLVGLGASGSAFADLFMSHPAVDRVGLCDREPERIKRFAGKESWQPKFDAKDAYETHTDNSQELSIFPVRVLFPSSLEH